MGVRGRGRLHSIAALLLLLAIAADLSEDSCHPLPQALTEAASISGAGAPSSEDACAGGCVPDCYCCSTISVTVAYVPQRAAGAATPLLAPAVHSYPPGVRPLPYHPPLTLS